MPRKRISEFRSKNIINALLGNAYVGWVVGSDLSGLKDVTGYESYVVKVDQAVKKRFKNGLVKLNIKQEAIAENIISMAKQGYDFFIVEPYVEHPDSDEKYVSFTRERKGIALAHSDSGGIDIEDSRDITMLTLNEDTIEKASEVSHFSPEQLRKILMAFDELHLSFLEINPYIVNGGDIVAFDIAIEVDSVAAHLVKSWSDADVRSSSEKYSSQELLIQAMNNESSASFNLSVLNKDGSVFLLLSGGGASVVIADEVYTLGKGNDIANYGEYSGNPTRHETYLYAKQVLELVLNSKASTKVLFIGGAVANFTDIAETFNGIIDALDERAEELSKESLEVFVRRGGPREKLGLKNIEKALKRINIFGGVYDATISIPDAVKNLIGGLK